MNTKKKINSDGKSFWYWVLFLALITTGIFSFGVMNEQEKKLKAELSPDQWAKGDKWINIAKDYLLKSDIQAKTVSVIMDSLTEFQFALYKDLQPQFNQLNKKIDSLNKKPKQ